MSVLKSNEISVVIVFAEKPMVVLRLVESTLRTKVSKSFVWIGSHGWTVTEHRDDHLYDSSRKFLVKYKCNQGLTYFQAYAGLK